MALYKTLTTQQTTKVLIWKIEESIADLRQGISLSENSSTRLQSMKSELHQKGFLIYDEFGKPHLKDGKFISITHSYTFSGIIISETCPVGIDIEKQREKILKIAPKFTPFEEYKTIANVDALVRKLTIVWGAKESLYKIYGKKKLLFLHHIFIEDFAFEGKKTTGEIRFDGKISQHAISFFEFEDFTCVFNNKICVSMR